MIKNKILLCILILSLILINILWYIEYHHLIIISKIINLSIIQKLYRN